MPDRNRTQRNAVLVIAAMIALMTTLAIHLLRLDRVVGLLVDDAWYVLLAKALATGHGYTLINSPTPGIVPFYPPGFPALLAIFYRLWPDFPANVWLLKSVSIAAMIGTGAIAYRYFAHQRALATPAAFALAFATAIYPPLVFLATSAVMSECVFTLAHLAAIFAIEESVRRGASTSSSWRSAATGGALASFAFLTRSAGVALLVGAVIYLLKEKLPKQALVFAAVVALLVAPWVLYARNHAPTAEQRVEQGGSIVLPYTTQFWHRVAGRPASGIIAMEDVPERVWSNLEEIGKADFGGFVAYSLYRPLEPGELLRLPDAATRVSLCFALIALAGYIAAVRERWSLAEIVVPLGVGVSLLWGWEQYRLLLPLVPFFFFYLLMGVRAIARLAGRFVPGVDPHRAGRRATLVVSWIFVVSSLHGNFEYLERRYDPQPGRRLQWISAFEENESFIRYIGANVPADEPIATQNPALVNLYTGHKTIASYDPATRWRVWNHLGVRYLAKTSPYPVELDASESRYPTIHRSDGFLNLRLLDLGPPSARPAWGEPRAPDAHLNGT